ncbi:MAG: C40 family peptidase [Saprospiraceae bacterium]|nr:C40 family peptidase [Saprospiraceae bacterium]
MSKWFLLAFLIGFGCSSGKKIRTDKLANEASLRSDLVREASQYLGSKYRYGGSDQRGFDCSGLVFEVFKSHGILLPRSSHQQSTYGRMTSVEKVRVGDLIFFKQKGKVNHVAIVSKTRRDGIWVIHSTTSRGVIQENLRESRYWSQRIYASRDVLTARR